MTPFIIYLLKSSASLALLFILYRLALSNEKRHRLNRFLLISILFVSALIPLIQIPVLQEKPVVKQVEFVRDLFIPEMQPVDITVQSTKINPSQEESHNYFNPLLFCYFLVIGFLLLKLLISFTRIFQLMKKAEKFEFQQFVLLVIKDFIQPFSFVNTIFISEKDYSTNKEILIAHEAEHIRLKHYIDLFLVEMFALLLWFNPFMWLLKRELKLIHEYQADQAVLKKGIDAQKYQLLVLEKAVGERRFALANYFTQKPILKRIKMMKKNKLNRWGGLKLILFVPLVVLLLQAFAKPETLIENVFEVVPVIQQVEKSKWLDKWTKENIGNGYFQPEFTIPASEKEKNILVILVNSKNEYLIENERATKEQVKIIVKDFLNGQDRKGNVVVDFEVKNIPLVGEIKVSKGYISFRNDLASSDEAINFTFHSIGEAYLEVRNEKAKTLFGEDYLNLDKDKKEAVDNVVPVRFSIAQSKNLNSTLKPPPPPPKVISVLSPNGEIPLITLHNDLIHVNEEDTCEIGQMNNILEKFLPQDRTQRKVKLIISTVNSEERVENVLNELKRIDGLEIMQVSVAPPPPPKVVKVLSPNNEIPFIILDNNRINVNVENCEIGQMNNILEKFLPDDGTQRKVELYISSVTSKERVENVLNELKRIDGLEIIQVSVAPPPPQKFEVKLYNDKIVLRDKEISLIELEKEANNFIKSAKDSYSANFVVEEGVSADKIEQIKEIFRKAKIEHVNYSTFTK